MHILTSTLALLLLLLPEVLFAQVNQSLINFNLNAQTGTDGFSNYVNLIYALSISAAALLAVIKIIIAGVKYMLTDVVTSKGDAIKEIKGALFGLLLIISAVLILTVINPQLIKSTLTFNPQPMPEVNVTPPVTSTGPAVDESGRRYNPVFFQKDITEYGDIQQDAVVRNGNQFAYNIANICSDKTGTEFNDCVDDEADNFRDFCRQNMGRAAGTAQQSLRCTVPIRYTSEDNFDRVMPVGTDHDEWENLCRQWGGVVYDDVYFSDQYCVWYTQPRVPQGVTI